MYKSLFQDASLHWCCFAWFWDAGWEAGGSGEPAPAPLCQPCSSDFGEKLKQIRWCWKPSEQGLLELIYCHLQLVTPADLRGCFKVAFISVCKKLRCFSATAVEKYRMKFVRDLDALSKTCRLMKNRSLFSNGFAHFSPSIHLVPLHCKHHPVCDTAGGWLKVASLAGLSCQRWCNPWGHSVSSHQSTDLCCSDFHDTCRNVIF